MGAEENKEIFKSIFPYGESALRSAILVNGGASVALLAFIGNLVAKNQSIPVVREFSFPLLVYVLGVLAAALSTGAAYATQYSYFHFSQNAGWLCHRITVIFLLLSYFAFGGASFLCYGIFRHLS